MRPLLDRERVMLAQAFIDTPRMGLTALAVEHGVSVTRIRQILDRALEKIGIEVRRTGDSAVSRYAGVNTVLVRRALKSGEVTTGNQVVASGVYVHHGHKLERDLYCIEKVLGLYAPRMTTAQVAEELRIDRMRVGKFVERGLRIIGAPIRFHAGGHRSGRKYEALTAETLDRVRKALEAFRAKQSTQDTGGTTC